MLILDRYQDTHAKRVRHDTGKHPKKFYEAELQRNMLAGIEEILAKIQRKEEDRAAKAANAAGYPDCADNGSETDIADPTSRDKTEISRTKPTKARQKNVAGSRLTGNVFEDAISNAGQRALTVDSAKTKSKAMTDLIANMPMKERRAAGGDKQRILEATRSLGFRTVSADGSGKWTMKGWFDRDICRIAVTADLGQV